MSIITYGIIISILFIRCVTDALYPYWMPLKVLHMSRVVHSCIEMVNMFFKSGQLNWFHYEEQGSHVTESTVVLERLIISLVMYYGDCTVPNLFTETKNQALGWLCQNHIVGHLGGETFLLEKEMSSWYDSMFRQPGRLRIWHIFS